MEGIRQMMTFNKIGSVLFGGAKTRRQEGKRQFVLTVKTLSVFFLLGTNMKDLR